MQGLHESRDLRCGWATGKRPITLNKTLVTCRRCLRGLVTHTLTDKAEYRRLANSPDARIGG